MQSSRDINAKENKRTQAFEQFDYLLNNFKNIKGTDTIIAKTYDNSTRWSKTAERLILQILSINS